MTNIGITVCLAQKDAYNVMINILAIHARLVI
jgi:hypothetical protein